MLTACPKFRKELKGTTADIYYISTIVYLGNTHLQNLNFGPRQLGYVRMDDLICCSTSSSIGGTLVYQCDSAGKLQGLLSHYSPFGYILMQCTLINGILNGPYQQFYPDGKCMHYLTFRDGRRDGIQIKFYPNGAIYNRSMYCYGVRDGWYSVYCPNGQLLMQKYYCMGRYFD